MWIIIPQPLFPISSNLKLFICLIQPEAYTNFSRSLCSKVFSKLKNLKIKYNKIKTQKDFSFYLCSIKIHCSYSCGSVLWHWSYNTKSMLQNMFYIMLSAFTISVNVVLIMIRCWTYLRIKKTFTPHLSTVKWNIFFQIMAIPRLKLCLIFLDSLLTSYFPVYIILWYIRFIDNSNRS